MAGKQSGLRMGFYVDGVDISGDTQSFADITKSLEVWDSTGIDKGAHERLPLTLDGSINAVNFFNPTGAHPVLVPVTTDRLLSVYTSNSVIGQPVASMTAKQFDYAPTRDNKGGLTAKFNSKSNAYWLDWGLSLTAGKRTDSAATNGTGVDFGASFAGYSFGIQAYLHVFAFTGTSATITVQSSSDNGVGDAWASLTGGAFTVVSAAPTKERIATARNLATERYLRVITTGTFSNLVFAVAATINQTDMTI